MSPFDPRHRFRSRPARAEVASAACDEPEFQLDGDVLVPDLAGWTRDRMPDAPDGVGVTIVGLALRGRVAFEGRLDRRENRYCGRGVECLWVVDAMQRTLEAYSGAALVGAPPFDASTIALSTL